jgi:hypothetical protein
MGESFRRNCQHTKCEILSSTIEYGKVTLTAPTQTFSKWWVGTD